MRRFASLRRAGDFSRLRSRGRRTATANFTFFREPDGTPGPRPLVGITVAKPVGTAVVRNRLRRRLGAALHELLPASPMRLLVVARPAAAALTFSALYDEVRRALR